MLFSTIYLEAASNGNARPNRDTGNRFILFCTSCLSCCVVFFPHATRLSAVRERLTIPFAGRAEMRLPPVGRMSGSSYQTATASTKQQVLQLPLQGARGPYVLRDLPGPRHPPPADPPPRQVQDPAEINRGNEATVSWYVALGICNCYVVLPLQPLKSSFSIELYKWTPLYSALFPPPPPLLHRPAPPNSPSTCDVNEVAAVTNGATLAAVSGASNPQNSPGGAAAAAAPVVGEGGEPSVTSSGPEPPPPAPPAAGSGSVVPRVTPVNNGPLPPG